MTREHSMSVGPYRSEGPNVRHIPNALVIALLADCERVVDDWRDGCQYPDVYGWGRAAWVREILDTWDLTEWVRDACETASFPHDLDPYVRHPRIGRVLVRVLVWRITNIAWRAPDTFAAPTGEPATCDECERAGVDPSGRVI